MGVLTRSAFFSDVLSTALHTVASEDVVSLVDKLSNHFNFSYFRIEEDGSKISNICF